MPKTSKHRYHGIAAGYRSGLEESTAENLRQRGVEAEYEKHKVKYIVPAREATYTPDFVFGKLSCVCPRCGGSGKIEEIPDSNRVPAIWRCTKCGGQGEILSGLIVETKGRFTAADRKKHLLIKEQHPDLDIRFLFQRSASRLSKKSKTTYADWCRKHGFQFADKVVPEEWLK